MATLIRPSSLRILPHIKRSIRPISTTDKPAATIAAAAQSAQRSQSHPTQQPFFQDEPQYPTIRTPIPGPKSRQAVAELDRVFDTRSLNMMANYQDSYGNYIADLDGNDLLDV